MKIALKAEKWNAKSADAMIVPMFEKEELKGLPKSADQILKDSIKAKECSGTSGQVLPIHVIT